MGGDFCEKNVCMGQDCGYGNCIIDNGDPKCDCHDGWEGDHCDQQINPDPTTQGPDPTTAEPEPTTEEPETTTGEPEPTTEEPKTTTMEPEPTTEEQETTPAEPEPTTEEGHYYNKEVYFSTKRCQRT